MPYGCATDPTLEEGTIHQAKGKNDDSDTQRRVKRLTNDICFLTECQIEDPFNGEVGVTVCQEFFFIMIVFCFFLHSHIKTNFNGQCYFAADSPFTLSNKLLLVLCKKGQMMSSSSSLSSRVFGSTAWLIAFSTPHRNLHTLSMRLYNRRKPFHQFDGDTLYSRNLSCVFHIKALQEGLFFHENPIFSKWNWGESK